MIQSGEFHLSLHLLRNLLDSGLAVHGQQVQLLVYELQPVLTVLFGLQTVDPTQVDGTGVVL